VRCCQRDSGECLVEEIVNHIDYIAIAYIDQHDIVIIADPAIRSVGVWQPVGPGIIDPILRSEESRGEMKTDTKPPVAITAIRGIIPTWTEDIAIVVAISAPVVPAIVSPALVPATLIAPIVEPAVVAPVVEPAVVAPVVEPAVVTPVVEPAVVAAISTTVLATIKLPFRPALVIVKPALIAVLPTIEAPFLAWRRVGAAVKPPLLPCLAAIEAPLLACLTIVKPTILATIYVGLATTILIYRLVRPPVLAIGPVALPVLLICAVVLAVLSICAVVLAVLPICAVVLAVLTGSAILLPLATIGPALATIGLALATIGLAIGPALAAIGVALNHGSFNAGRIV
jgi:hypothetical protein